MTLSHVRRASHGQPRPIQYMRVNHGGGNVRMPQEFLYRPDVIACLQKMCRKRMSQGVAAHLFDQTSFAGCGLDSLLQAFLI